MCRLLDTVTAVVDAATRRCEVHRAGACGTCRRSSCSCSRGTAISPQVDCARHRPPVNLRLVIRRSLMRMRDWKNHRLALGLVVMACALVDVGTLTALVSAVSWLFGATSPLLWGGLCAAAIVTVRSARLLRWVWNVRQLASASPALTLAETGQPDAAAERPSRRSLPRSSPESARELSRSTC
jgi:hypothetical protein